MEVIKKYALAIAVILCTVQTLSSQNLFDSTNDIQIEYDVNFKKFVDSENKRTELALLQISNNKSFFIWKNMISIDSLKRDGELTVKEALRFFNLNTYSISIDGSKMIYTEEIESLTYRYYEDLNLNWEFLDGIKLILGYKCRKARAFYAGRVWIAWYCTDVPIDAGPYKFKGLPGLILQVTDDEELFNFEAISIAAEGIAVEKLERLRETKNEIKILEHQEFNVLKTKINAMSWNERMNYFNTNKEVSMESRSIDTETGEIIKERPARKLLQIEKEI